MAILRFWHLYYFLNLYLLVLIFNLLLIRSTSFNFQPRSFARVWRNNDHNWSFRKSQITVINISEFSIFRPFESRKFWWLVDLVDKSGYYSPYKYIKRVGRFCFSSSLSHFNDDMMRIRHNQHRLPGSLSRFTLFPFIFKNYYNYEFQLKHLNL